MAKRTPKLETTHAVVYVRVSSDRQAQSGLGREAQEARCRESAAHRGWQVTEPVFVDDAKSGMLPLEKREGLQRAIAAVRARPGSVLLVYSLSRFVRRQSEFYRLLGDAGDLLPLVSATEPFDLSTAMGKAFAGMLVVINGLEHDLASERTTEALAAAKERGTKLGAPSMVESTDDEGKRFVDPAKVALVRQVQALYATERFSHRSLADHLNEQGIASVTGAKWHAKTVRTALNTEVTR